VPVFRNNPELLAAFRAGRPHALEQVYRTYVQSIDRLLRSLARASRRRIDVSATADLLQEVFIRAFSPSARLAYDGKRDFEPYLATIARNCFIDALRTQGHEVPRSSEELLLTMDEAIEDPDSGEDDPRVMAVLASYVSTLPGDVAGVYRLRFVLGQSQDQTSATLGISRRAVRTMEERLHRGLKKALVRAGISLRELAHERDFPAEIAGPVVLKGRRA